MTADQWLPGAEGRADFKGAQKDERFLIITVEMFSQLNVSVRLIQLYTRNELILFYVNYTIINLIFKSGLKRKLSNIPIIYNVSPFYSF